MDWATAFSGGGIVVTLGGAMGAAWRRVNGKLNGHDTRIAVVEIKVDAVTKTLDEIKVQTGKMDEKMDRVLEHLLNAK